MPFVAPAPDEIEEQGFTPPGPDEFDESEGEKLARTTGKTEQPVHELGFLEYINTPITHLFNTSINELTGQDKPAEPELSPTMKAAYGGNQGVNDLADSLLTPLGVTLLGTGGLPRLVQRVVAGLFAFHAVKNAPQQIKEFKQALDEKDPEKATRLGVGLVGSAGVIYGAGRHALKGETPVTPPTPGTPPPSGIQPEPFTTPDNLEGLAARSRAILPRAAQAAQEAAAEQPAIESEEQNASGEQEATAVHGDVRTQPGEGEGEVPEPESGGGIQSQAGGGLPEGSQGEVLLNQLKTIGDAPAGSFGKALKESGFPATTNWAYDMATRVSTGDIPALLEQAKKADVQNRAALEQDQVGDQGMKGQFFRETVRMRQALDDAIAKGAQTDEELANIAGEHGVGAGLDPALKAKELKAALAKAQPETITEFEPGKVQTQEVPVEQIMQSADVPNFKRGADPETGVVPGEELKGEYQRLGTGPIIVWKRKNGRLEVITGRHRLDLAKRSGEKTIPAQVVEESKGFTRDMALTADAEANIRDNQGTTEDYAHYFKHTPQLTEKAAGQRGLLSRAKGKAGFDLARHASDDLQAAWQAGKIGEAQALAITRAAPGNDAAQQIGLKFALDGKAPDFLSNVVKAAISESGGSARALDLFGRDDATMRAMEEQAKRASDIQKQLREQLGAISGAAKKPEVARQLGVDVNDPEAVQAKVDHLRAELQRWENWPVHKDLVEQTRATKGGETIEKEKGQKEKGVLKPEPEITAQPAAKAAPEEQPAKSVTPPVAPAKTPSTELFPSGETPFNLTSQKPTAPTEKPAESTTAYGKETAAQQEMFSIQKIVEDKDPEKSANAAQQIAGGDPAKAASQLRRQLQVVDSDPVTKRNFKKEQRERLKEVIALLDQRASGGGGGGMRAGPGAATRPDLVPGEPDLSRNPGNPDIYGVAERVRQQRAAAGQVAPVPPGEGIGAEESVEHGRQLIANGANPERVLANFEKTNRLSADDMAIVRARGEQLALAASKTEIKYGTDSPEYRAAWTELSAWDTRTKPMQTEWHKTGQAQQGETDIDTGTFTGLQRAFKQVSGKDFTAAQATKAKATAKAVTQADITADAARQKLFDELDRQAVVQGGKPGTPAMKPANAVWNRVREYIKQGLDNFDDIRNKVATDLGMKVDQVTKLMTQSPRAKRLADEVWRTQLIARRLKDQAKRWLTIQATPRVLRALQSIPRVLFSLKVGFHGTVALGTHAPMVAFQPPFWKTYAENFGKMYRMVGSERYYERQVQDLLRRPNYTEARRAGLVNDPYIFEDYTSPKIAAYFGKITGMGNRGYSVLKMLRQDMFDQHWNQLPETSKIPEVAEAIADGVNHATGVVKGRAPKGTHLVLFAPRLEASRAAWLAVDPAKAGATFAHWKTATEAEKTFAIHQVKEKAWVAGTMFGLLALNQGILSATGSKQKINVTDPMKSDFLKFKIAGMDVSYGNPMITMARLPIRLNALREKGGKGKLAHLIYPDESMSSEAFKYARTQLSPFAGLVADVAFKGDYENRPLPKMPGSGPRLPMPRRLAVRGEKPYTWPEFTIDQTLPIPAEEAVRDVWKKGLGMSDAQVKAYGKAFAKALVMGATGARLSEDYDKKKATSTEQPPNP